MFNIFGPIRKYTSLCIDYHVERCKISVILFGSMWVTAETLIVETEVWPMPFLINMFAALKGSQF